MPPRQPTQRTECRGLARTLNADRLFDPSDVQRLAVIDVFYPGSIDWRVRYDRVRGILQIDIGAKNRLAGSNVLAVNSLGCAKLKIPLMLFLKLG